MSVLQLICMYSPVSNLGTSSKYSDILSYLPRKDIIMLGCSCCGYTLFRADLCPQVDARVTSKPSKPSKRDGWVFRLTSISVAIDHALKSVTCALLRRLCKQLIQPKCLHFQAMSRFVPTKEEGTEHRISHTCTQRETKCELLACSIHGASAMKTGKRF